jgi:hypothetical protein
VVGPPSAHCCRYAFYVACGLSGDRTHKGQNNAKDQAGCCSPFHTTGDTAHVINPTLSVWGKYCGGPKTRAFSSRKGSILQTRWSYETMGVAIFRYIDLEKNSANLVKFSPKEDHSTMFHFGQVPAVYTLFFYIQGLRWIQVSQPSRCIWPETLR